MPSVSAGRSALTRAQAITSDAEDKKVAALQSTEADFKGMPGYYRDYKPVRRADGTINPDGYEWGVRFKPAAAEGKMTKAAEAVLERIKPGAKAADALQRKRQAAQPKVMLYNARGQAQYVSPERAGVTARANRWRDTARSKGRYDGRGPGGMLFLYGKRGWQPSGRWCYTRPWSQERRPKAGNPDGSMKPKGVQLDPNGGVWRYLAGQWRRTG